MTWPYETTTGSDQNLTLMLGEAVTNSRHTLRHLERINDRLDQGEVRMDHLSEENIRRQSEHEALKVRVDHLEPIEKDNWLLAFPEWMETGVTVIRTLASVREWVTWMFLTTGAYKVLTSPVESKQFILWILGLDHH